MKHFSFFLFYIALFSCIQVKKDNRLSDLQNKEDTTQLMPEKNNILLDSIYEKKGNDKLKSSSIKPIRDVLSFSKDLIARKYGEFFIYPMHDETIEKIWNDKKNRPLLDSILINNNIEIEAKFLACEIFFKKDIFFMRRHPIEKIAEIYTQALVHNYTGMANSWGLLYEHEDEGTVGIEFLVFGKKAIPSLAKLLDNTNTNLEYDGSKEATVGNGYHFRIKDFAAYYIGRIMGNPLKYYPNVIDRDVQIEKLKKEIELYYTNNK